MARTPMQLSTQPVSIEIAPVSVHVTPELVRNFTRVAKDTNASHYDDEAARAQGFRSAIVHGAVGASLILRLLSQWQGRALQAGEEVEFSFLAPICAGDQVTVRGVVEATEAEMLCCEVWCEDQEKRKLIVGRATLSRSEARQTAHG